MSTNRGCVVELPDAEAPRRSFCGKPTWTCSCGLQDMQPNTHLVNMLPFICICLHSCHIFPETMTYTCRIPLCIFIWYLCIELDLMFSFQMICFDIIWFKSFSLFNMIFMLITFTHYTMWILICSYFLCRIMSNRLSAQNHVKPNVLQANISEVLRCFQALWHLPQIPTHCSQASRPTHALRLGRFRLLAQQSTTHVLQLWLNRWCFSGFPRGQSS